MNQLFPRFVALEKKYGSLIRGMRKARPRGGSGAPKTVFMSLAGGLSELVEALKEKLPPRSVLLGRKVRGLERKGDRYTVETAAGEYYSSRALVLALPTGEAARLTGGLSPELANNLSGYKSVSTAVVFLGFRREDVRHPLGGYGFVVPASEGLHLLASTFVSTKFPNRSPHSHVLLRGFVGGARDPAVLDWSDEGLVDLVRKELSGILGELPEPTLGRVYRWSQATPQVEVGHGSHLAELDRLLAARPGLQVTGNGLRGIGIPDCISDGQRVAEETARYLGNVRQKS